MDMINALGAGLLLTFSWSTFSLMMIGIVIGFIVGILPGLGGPPAMALMLPFVFKMSAVEAFAFLLGMTGNRHDRRYHIGFVRCSRGSQPRHPRLSMGTRWRETARREERWVRFS